MEGYMKQTITALLLLLWAPVAIYAAPLTAHEVAEKAYHIEDGDDFTSLIAMKIVKANGKVKARDLAFWRKDRGEESRALLLFRSPADVKGTSFLTWNHPEKNNEQWLYLPALKRVKRIPQSGRSKSFMGSDFSFDDMSKRPLFKDTHTLMDREAIKGADCYVLEAVAKKNGEPFPKRVHWIRADNFIVVRTDFYNAEGEVSKRFTGGNIRPVNGIATLFSVRMDDLEDGGHSTMDLSRVAYNSGLPDRMFTVQGLKK